MKRKSRPRLGLSFCSVLRGKALTACATRASQFFVCLFVCQFIVVHLFFLVCCLCLFVCLCVCPSIATSIHKPIMIFPSLYRHNAQETLAFQPVKPNGLTSCSALAASLANLSQAFWRNLYFVDTCVNTYISPLSLLTASLHY